MPILGRRFIFAGKAIVKFLACAIVAVAVIAAASFAVPEARAGERGHVGAGYNSGHGQHYKGRRHYAQGHYYRGRLRRQAGLPAAGHYRGRLRRHSYNYGFSFSYYGYPGRYGYMPHQGRFTGKNRN